MQLLTWRGASMMNQIPVADLGGRGTGPRSSLILGKKEEKIEGRKAGRVSKSKPSFLPPPSPCPFLRAQGLDPPLRWILLRAIGYSSGLAGGKLTRLGLDSVFWKKMAFFFLFALLFIGLDGWIWPLWLCKKKKKLVAIQPLWPKKFAHYWTPYIITPTNTHK